MAVQHKGPNAAIEAAIAECDNDLRALQVRYEQYFLGIERREPAEDREALRRGVMALKRENIRNTALKFRINGLWNKLLSYERMWNRTVKEIEEGRYRRDVFKAKLRGYDTAAAKSAAKKRAKEPSTIPGAAEDERGAQGGEGARAPDGPSAPMNAKATTAASNGDGVPAGARKATAAPGAAPAGASSGLSGEKIDKLYKAFVTAKRKCKQDVSGLSRDGLERSLKKQLPALQSKHKCKSVDFKVVIRGGKAVLKAVPR